MFMVSMESINRVDGELTWLIHSKREMGVLCLEL